MNELTTDIDLEKPKTKDDKFTLMRKRYQACLDADNENYADAVDDFKFIWLAGHQWDNNFGSLRGDRPKYEFNKLRQSVKQVVNDIRQNTPSIKVRPAHDEQSDMAEIRQGIIRNIEQQSNADTVYDWAALYSVSSGFGVWRVNTKYSDDDSFDQDIVIERIHNPFSVHFDPDATTLDRRDGKFAFVEDDISPADFKRRWPKADVRSFDSATGSSDNALRHWFGAKTIKIAEYWQITPETFEILLLDNGKVVRAIDPETKAPFDEDLAANPPVNPQTGQPIAPPVNVLDRRTVDGHKVTMEIVSGLETLEGPYDWAGKFIPLVPCWGDFVHVDGKDEWYGMARMSRDACILNNFALSTFAEQIASQPNAPFMYTPAQIKGFEDEWSNLATNNAPGLPYNKVEGLGAPERSVPPQMSPGYLTLLNVTSDAIKATTGLFDPSLGQKSNETSGKAIVARQREGDVANFDYSDSLSRSIRFTGEIVNDLIPYIYDTQRSMRILGEDGTHKFIEVNKPVPDPRNPGQFIIENDIREGKYDIAVTTGPSYTTQRMETLDACMQLAKSVGPMQALAQYGVLKSMDVAGMDEIKDAFRKSLVKQGLLEPAEGEQPQAPPPPNPLIVAKVNALGKDIEKTEAETAKIKMETVLMPSTAQADIRAQLSVAIANEVKSMISSGELDSMIRYNASQFAGPNGTNTPDNPHYVAPVPVDPNTDPSQATAPDGIQGQLAQGAQ